MRVDELEHELRAQRPEPGGEFARELDEWAAAGFPRRGGPAGRPTARAAGARGLWARLADAPPRRMLLPAGALATVVIVAGVAITRVDSGVESPGPVGGDVAVSEQAVQKPGGPGAGEALIAPDTAETPELAPGTEAVPPGPGGVSEPGVGRQAEDRIVDATAQLTLGAPADEVQEVANDVVEVADRHRAIVLSSQVSSDDAGARAAFELEVPYRELDATIADLSELADVISRTEAGQDITAGAVRAQRALARTLEQIREARVALIRADGRERRLVIRSEIESLQATADAQRAEIAGVRRAGRFATVGVDVTSQDRAGDGSWGLDDAVGDARDVLETIGGVALISVAILLPLALVVALVALVAGRVRRRRREAALDA